MSAISAFEERQQVSDTIRSEIKSMMDEGVNDSIIVNSFTQRGVPIGVVMQSSLRISLLIPKPFANS